MTLYRISPTGDLLARGQRTSALPGYDLKHFRKQAAVSLREQISNVEDLLNQSATARYWLDR